MNQVFSKQFETALRGVEIQIPQQFTQILDSHIDQTRSTYQSALDGMKSYANTVMGVVEKQQAGAVELRDRAIENSTANVAAALDAAQALTRAGSLKDAMDIQARYAKGQAARFVEQSQQMTALASKIGTDAFTAWLSVIPKPGRQ